MQALPSSSVDEPWDRDTPEHVLAQAELLLAAARGGTAGALLRGRHLALLCSDAGQPAARLFHVAVEALGARVSDIAPLHPDAAGRHADTARLLGRLYDAIECQGLESTVVAELRSHAGVPVFAGLATDAHPSAWLAARLDAPDPERRRVALLQAVLVRALSS
jgi:ornithine carbamoyltransferase